MQSGVLNKRGEALFKGWAERLVVLDALALRYYDVSYKDTEQLPSNKARGLVPLSSRSQVLKLDGELAPRSRGAGLDWKGSVTDGKGMPFCFKIQTAGKEYVFQAYTENERSAWIQVLHVRIDYLSTLDPRYQHQHQLSKEKTSVSGHALSPLSGRSDAEEVSEEEGEDEEVSDMLLMTQGLSQQLKLALKAEVREGKRKYRAEIMKKAKEEARGRGEVFEEPAVIRREAKEKKEKEGAKEKKERRGLGEAGGVGVGVQASKNIYKKQPPPPPGLCGVTEVSAWWCTAPDMRDIPPSCLSLLCPHTTTTYGVRICR